MYSYEDISFRTNFGTKSNTNLLHSLLTISDTVFEQQCTWSSRFIQVGDVGGHNSLQREIRKYIANVNRNNSDYDIDAILT